MKIPKEVQDKYDEISLMINEFCDLKLSAEYKVICLKLLAKLCRKRPSPLNSGKPGTWAAGIIQAVGNANFLFDKTQKIHIKSSEIACFYGISSSTSGSKAADIRKMFDVSYFNPEWLLAENTENNPAIWHVMVNGLIHDVRSLPVEIQQQAYERGIIPYVPGNTIRIESTSEKIVIPDGESTEKKINKGASVKKQKNIDKNQNLLFEE